MAIDYLAETDDPWSRKNATEPDGPTEAASFARMTLARNGRLATSTRPAAVYSGTLRHSIFMSGRRAFWQRRACLASGTAADRRRWKSDLLRAPLGTRMSDRQACHQRWRACLASTGPTTECTLSGRFLHPLKIRAALLDSNQRPTGRKFLGFPGISMADCRNQPHRLAPRG